MSLSGTRGYPRALVSGSGLVGLGPIQKLRARTLQKARKNDRARAGSGSGPGPIHPYRVQFASARIFKKFQNSKDYFYKKSKNVDNPTVIICYLCVYSNHT